jgi:radical SAM modification target selenobiotic family peptide
MDKNDMKKLLAGMSLVALIGGAGLSLTGCATTTGTASRADKTSADQELKDFTPDDLSG